MITTVAQIDDNEFKKVQALIYREAGISLSDAKRNLVQSRLMKRLRYHNLNSYREYLNLLANQGESGDEITHLINSLTTNKTDFFRESHHFEFIHNRLLPEVKDAANKGARSRRIRMWHAGCSTGQEPYSNAMTICDGLGDTGTWDVKLLASDIDTNVLAAAREGEYRAEQVAPIPAGMRERYMDRDGRGPDAQYRVSQEIKSKIVFRQINLTDEPWPIRSDTRFDAIFCRNVIIYFDKPTQRRLFERFEHYLMPGGYLFIGHSETLFGISTAYESVGGTIYRKPLTSASEAA
ncbi:MAG TPA: protein-glutamate O-methyltransferase CheR [Capsulimonadaceae bacterium]|jgi:chemotaxis protein methyltransferase CheR